MDNHYRVSLTKEVRRALGVGPGDYVAFQVTEDGTVHLRKVLFSIAPLPSSLSRRPTLHPILREAETKAP